MPSRTLRRAERPPRTRARRGVTQGPWAPGKAKRKSGAALAGLTNSRQFTTKGNALAAYQKLVVTWTLEAHWYYDDVYWEIANEPEEPGTNANTVDVWQDDVIALIRSSNGEQQYVGANKLGACHLLAVNPFTNSPTAGVGHYAADSRVSILGGHYQETLKVSLGSKPGSFTAQWLDPVTGLPKGGSITLTAPCPAAGCAVTSPLYDDDLLLKITQNP